MTTIAIREKACVLRRGEMDERAPASIVGLYSTSAVDWIERYIVTEAMVDAAQAQRRKGLGSLGDRRRIRRSIAIGIRCGAYQPGWLPNLSSDIMGLRIIEGPRDVVSIRGRGTTQLGAVDA